VILPLCFEVDLLSSMFVVLYLKSVHELHCWFSHLALLTCKISVRLWSCV